MSETIISPQVAAEVHQFIERRLLPRLLYVAPFSLAISAKFPNGRTDEGPNPPALAEKAAAAADDGQQHVPPQGQHVPPMPTLWEWIMDGASWVAEAEERVLDDAEELQAGPGDGAHSLWSPRGVRPADSVTSPRSVQSPSRGGLSPGRLLVTTRWYLRGARVEALMQMLAATSPQLGGYQVQVYGDLRTPADPGQGKRRMWGRLFTLGDRPEPDVHPENAGLLILSPRKPRREFPSPG